MWKKCTSLSTPAAEVRRTVEDQELKRVHTAVDACLSVSPNCCSAGSEVRNRNHQVRSTCVGEMVGSEVREDGSFREHRQGLRNCWWGMYSARLQLSLCCLDICSLLFMQAAGSSALSSFLNVRGGSSDYVCVYVNRK